MKPLFCCGTFLFLVSITFNVSAGGGDQYTGATLLAEPEPEIVKSTVTKVSTAGDGLRGLLGNLASLEANFGQRVADADGYEIQSMSGHLTVARPGKIHWQTRPPYEQLLVCDAETLWLYDKDLEQVTVRPFERDIVNSPAMLFIGDLAELESKYVVSRTGVDSGVTEFTLVPKDSGTVYRKLTVQFAGEIPIAMGLWDSLGQMTQIEFSEVKLNPEVDEAKFVFAIPDGVDVLYND